MAGLNDLRSRDTVASTLRIGSMPSIFVSYRHSDAPGQAGRLHDRLVERFGEANVFKDLASTEPGADYEEVIKDTLARCDALIAVIGKDWLAPGPDGASRLHDRRDWVRMELANALRRKEVRVVPVLVAGAKMPSSADLPKGVKSLTRRQAVVLIEDVWNLQVAQLVDSLERASETERPRKRPAKDQDAWNVRLLPSSEGVHTLELRFRGVVHELTLHAQPEARPRMTLDGRVRIIHGRREENVWGIRRHSFALRTPGGSAKGILFFKTRRDTGLEWLLLEINGELAYQEGDVPPLVRNFRPLASEAIARGKLPF